MCHLDHTVCCFRIEHYHYPLAALCAEGGKAMGNPYSLQPAALSGPQRQL